MKKELFFILLLLSPLVSIASSKTFLQISDAKGKQIKFSQAQLLARKDLEEITISKGIDPAYPDQEMHYTAVKVSQLFKGLNQEEGFVLAFEATDGFSASLLPRTSELAFRNAYVAIESKNKVWPDLAPLHTGKFKGSAGPFYLVWPTAKNDKIGNEEWPFKLAALKLVPTFSKQYPKTVPVGEMLDSSVTEGFLAFQKSCFACHTLNLEGLDKKGPDLNYPESPIEYFGVERLKRFVRNPQSVRAWKTGQMIPFSPEALSEVELDKIIAYLTYMSKNKN